MGNFSGSGKMTLASELIGLASPDRRLSYFVQGYDAVPVPKGAAGRALPWVRGSLAPDQVTLCGPTRRGLH